MTHAAGFFRTAVAACDALGCAGPTPDEVPGRDPGPPAPAGASLRLRPVPPTAPALRGGRPPRRDRHDRGSPGGGLPATHPAARVGPTGQRRTGCRVGGRPGPRVAASEQRTDESRLGPADGPGLPRPVPGNRESSRRGKDGFELAADWVEQLPGIAKMVDSPRPSRIATALSGGPEARQEVAAIVRSRLHDRAQFPEVQRTGTTNFVWRCLCVRYPPRNTNPAYHATHA